MSRTVLIVDDLATNRIVIKVLLERAHYKVVQAATARAALAQIAAGRPDLIVLDMTLPDLDGAALCRQLKSDPDTADLPVIVVAASREPHVRIAALAAGADEFLAKPLHETGLLARVRNLMRARATTQDLALRQDTRRALGFAEPAPDFAGPGRIALIAPPRLARDWRAALSRRTPDRITALTRAEALAPDSAGAAPDLFVIGAAPGDEAASLALVSELRTSPATRHAAILVAIPDSARDSAAMALDIGADDVVPVPLDIDELVLRLRNQLHRHRRATALRGALEDGLRLAVTDPLTGLYNRRYALPHLARIAAQSGQTGQDFALIAADIDRFKRINDRYGHAAGDAVIAEIARRLKAPLRDTDLIARIGGEEFLIALPDTGRARARHGRASALRGGRATR